MPVSDSHDNDVVIVGGGLAAQRCAEALRRGGFEDRVTIVSNELTAPYDRPPLSKAFLAGDADETEIAFRPEGWHGEQDIELLLGDAAAGLDPDARTVELASGEQVPYGQLVIATGSRARPLPGAEPYANVHALRSLDDAVRLRAALGPGVRLVVLGAGLIGQEVAATAHKLGAQVTLVEAAPLPLARALHPELAQWLVDLQRSQGVEVLLGQSVTALTGEGDRLDALCLADGSRIDLDVLLVGIGVMPNTEWLPAPVAELVVRPEIHAAGDVAGGDHWEAAGHQGRSVARAILGQEPGPAPVTSWWSDVHGIRLQGLGSPAGTDALEIDGELAAHAFTAIATAGGVPRAALAVGRPRELPRLRQLLTPTDTTAQEAA